MKRALITGVTGQDGSYLAELLLEKGYAVHGMVRRSSLGDVFPRLDPILRNPLYKGRLYLHEGDLADALSLRLIFDRTLPDEVYNLGAMSHVKTSFDVPEYTGNVNGLGTLRILELMRMGYPKVRLYQASTSELFGKVQEIPQRETTPFYPRSPYGVAKMYAYWAVINYREAYNLFASNGILFNHESPRRGENFISRKITLAVARIALGRQSRIVLGNLDAKRDWGYAKDFVEGMWMILQHPIPEDFVLGTGETCSVRTFVELAFQEIGITIEWQGAGLQEKGIDAATGNVYVEVSPEFFRPTEVEVLLSDPSKAKKILGWRAKTPLKSLISLMVQADLEQQSQLSGMHIPGIAVL